MKILELLKKLFGFKKKEKKPTRVVEGRKIPEPSNKIMPKVKPVKVTQKDIPWVYPKNHSYVADPDGGKRELSGLKGKPTGVVIHHTATYTLNATINHFKKNVVDVHFVIGRNGEVVQMVNCNRTAAHAGKSKWDGKTGLNSHYIGIEVVNIGWLTKKDDQYFDGYKRPWNGKVRERHTQGQKYWEPFTPAQEKAVFNLCYWLCKTYGILPQNIAGHFEVSPRRKNDPAGGFSMSFDQFRTKVGDLIRQR